MALLIGVLLLLGALALVINAGVQRRLREHRGAIPTELRSPRGRQRRPRARTRRRRRFVTGVAGWNGSSCSGASGTSM